jgi:ribosomal protein S18 acetylase RimI-like enzyme
MGLSVSEDLWLSGIMGFDCHKCEVQSIESYLKEVSLLERIKPFFITIRALEDFSLQRHSIPTELNFIQQMYHYRWSANKGWLNRNKSTIREHKTSDIPEILKIAKGAFVYSRFHQDPRIKQSVADRIKSEWILSNLTKRDNAVTFVSITPAGKISGFNSILIESDQINIDLIAVGEDYRRKGVARSLILRCQELSTSIGKPILVGTQATNPATEIYKNLGFSIQRVTYIWHDLNLNKQHKENN